MPSQLGSWPGLLVIAFPSCALALWFAIGRLESHMSLLWPALIAAICLWTPALLLLPGLSSDFRARPPASIIAGSVLVLGGVGVLLLARHWHRRRQALQESPPAPESITSPPEATQPVLCLCCRHPLSIEEGVADPCAGCGSSNAIWQRRIFWTLDPKLVRLEALTKTAIVLLCLGLGIYILLNMPTMSGTGGGFGPGLLLAAAAALWQTASKITRHETLFGAALFWILVFWIPASLLLPFTLVAVYMLLQGTGPWSQDSILLLLAVEAGFVLAGLLVHLAARRLANWKQRRLQA